MIEVKVQLPGGLADDHERLIPRQSDAVGEAESVQHDGRLAGARVVPEEAAGGAGLYEVVVPPVEAEPGAGVAEVDRAVGGFDRRVREPGGGRAGQRAAHGEKNQRWLYSYDAISSGIRVPMPMRT